jgi:hypothetical protein
LVRGATKTRSRHSNDESTRAAPPMLYVFLDPTRMTFTRLSTAPTLYPAPGGPLTSLCMAALPVGGRGDTFNQRTCVLFGCVLQAVRRGELVLDPVSCVPDRNFGLLRVPAAPQGLCPCRLSFVLRSSQREVEKRRPAVRCMRMQAATSTYARPLASHVN